MNPATSPITVRSGDTVVSTRMSLLRSAALEVHEELRQIGEEGMFTAAEQIALERGLKSPNRSRNNSPIKSTTESQ